MAQSLLAYVRRGNKMGALTLNELVLALAILFGAHAFVILPWVRKRLAASSGSATWGAV